MPSLRRNNLLPATVIVVLGFSLAIWGYRRSIEPLTSTTGVITECSPVGGFKTSVFLMVRYTYDVAGKQYGGQALVRNPLASDAPYQAGRKLPVFVVRAAPECSYAFGRPTALPWIVGGTILVILGGIILLCAGNT